MNIFEMHNSINYFYKKPPDRLSYKLIRFLTCSYDVKYENLYSDVFGVLGDRKFFDLPVYDDSDVIATAIERARELPEINLMWSGGVDSTFILACYKLSGTPVRVWHYDNPENYVSPKLVRYIEKNFDCNILKTTDEALKVTPAYLGSLADCFFFSHQRLRGTFKALKLPLQHGRMVYKPIYVDRPYVPLEDRMRSVIFHEGFGRKRRLFTDAEIMQVVEYVKRFGKPVDSNNRIARFLCFTCSFLKQAFGWSGPFYHGLNSFFMTQKFINIAYTKYWDSNEKPWLHDKKMFKDVIVQAFGSDFGVEKNFF